MDVKKLVKEQELSDYPIGLGGCRISDFSGGYLAFLLPDGSN